MSNSGESRVSITTTPAPVPVPSNSRAAPAQESLNTKQAPNLVKERDQSD